METINREIQTYKKGEIIFSQGDEAKCMYDVHWGSVGIYANYGTKQEKLLKRLVGNEYFGEMGLVDNAPRSATAVALENDTMLEVITGETLSTYIKERPAKVLAIMQNMSVRVRELTRDYMNACKAISEAIDLEDSGGEKSEELQSKLKRYNDIYRSSVKGGN
ncbi:MAG: cyclic nucleotide-binding domain-containing protein [Oscillospiraceae bacterium]|nr:cyclic nucleotide-binding domain-containing protein [Oscillospiraceae bacterium]